ncbi:MAG: retroviral-like aspartic protease family protein, partial [Allosphingosinicella sp.]
LAAASIGAAPPAAPPAVPLAPAAGDDGVSLALGEDRNERMTVPVSIGATGPYAFIVDTGAERTVISEQLAARLGLGAAGKARVHSMTEVSDIETFTIPSLQVGGRQVRDIRAPGMDRHNLGAEGMLGVDSLQQQRVSFDFDRDVMTVVPSRRSEDRWVDGAIVVTAKSRLGHLVLVDASVDGEKVWVIVDTGSQVTIGNTALRHKLERRGKMKLLDPVQLLSVTGGRASADESVVKHIRLGGVDIYDMPVAFSDVHPFKKLGLTDRPALLLGMDALKLFERVSVDFANRRVRLLARSHGERAPTSRMAAVAGVGRRS